MSASHTARELAQLEDARAALAHAMRSVALEPSARLLEVLPPAGVEGWMPAWAAGVGLAQDAAHRWGNAVQVASSCAVAGTDREELAHLGGELATVVKEALMLVGKLSTAVDA